MKSILPQVWLLIYDPGKIVIPVDQLHLFSTSDHKRFAAIRHKDTRTQFALARLLAGSVLEKTFGNQALEWTIGYEKKGRPRLEDCSNNITAHISISHTAGMVAFAVSPSGLIGVDVENQSRKTDIELLAREVFSNGESTHFNTLSSMARRSYFFQCWTLKEAYTKALGLGLYAAFRSIEMQATAADEIILQNKAPDDPHSALSWHLYHTIVMGSFHVAIAHMNTSRLERWHLRKTSLKAAKMSFEAFHLELKKAE